MQIHNRRLISLFFALLVSPFTLNAAPILIFDGANQVTGARGVEVNGALYDVDFSEGTCIDVFNGCTAGTDSFFWKTSSQAESASLALLDQVFVDGFGFLFDTQPDQTSGCQSTAWCQTITPFERFSLHNTVNGFAAYNNLTESSDFTTLSLVDIDLDLGSQANLTWAVWSSSIAVSEPPLVWLMLASVLTLGLMRTGRQ